MVKLHLLNKLGAIRQGINIAGRLFLVRSHLYTWKLNCRERKKGELKRLFTFVDFYVL